MTPRLRPILALAALLVCLAALPALGQQQEDLRLRIVDSELLEDGTTQVVVSVTGPQVEGDVLEADAFTVREQDTEIDQVAVEPLLESQSVPVAVALVIDRSTSTAGDPIERAKAAVVAAIDDLGTNVDISVIAFSGEPTVLAPFGSGTDALIDAVQSIQSDGETAMYDAVTLGGRELEGRPGQHHLVLFSDGADSISQATLEQAVAAAQAANAPIKVVALETDELDTAAIQQLADGTDGEVIPAQSAAELALAFEDVTTSIASQYVLTYTGTETAADELDILVEVSAANARASDGARVINPRVALAADLPSFDVEEPGLLESGTGLWIGLGAAFLAVALLLLSIATKTETGASETLRRTLTLYTTGDRAGRDRGGMPRGDLTRRATELVDRLPKPSGYEERLQLKIDRAGWQLRASEFLGLQIGSLVVGAILGWALTGGLIAPLAVGVLAPVVPSVVLEQRVQRRFSDFMEQLPETLNMIASSLKAGYGLVQAVDTVVREAPAPTSEEFSRALVENRLGLPIAEALENMAERIQSEDFAWVVMAINIQSEVGGNLAELLTTVADTLRERERIHRQVRVLSAEGRLSMWVLLALPPFLAFYMAIVNREYVELLLGTSIGRIMVIASLALNLLGYLWMRRVVEIDV